MLSTNTNSYRTVFRNTAVLDPLKKNGNLPVTPGWTPERESQASAAGENGT